MLFPAQRAHGSNPPNPLGPAERPRRNRPRHQKISRLRRRCDPRPPCRCPPACARRRPARESSAEVPAVLENVEHRTPFLVKFEALVQLHLSGQPRVVPLHKDHAVEYLSNLLLHAQSPAPVPYGRVGNAAERVCLPQLPAPSSSASFCRDLSGRAGHADASPPPARSRRAPCIGKPVPPRPPPKRQRKRPRVSVVETDHPRPVPWNFERFDDVRV